MADYRSKTWLYRWLLQKQQRRTTGFTLTEVLISIAIAGVIISGLLFLVVELLQIDRREIALERVQRDMQRALDYIADDLEEAVYVYDNDSLLEIVDNIALLSDEMGPGGPGSGEAVPLLAFWRTVPLDDDDLLDDCSAAPDEEACLVARTRRASYSLVVYYQQHRDDGDATSPWEGQSVLRRYELPQYADLSTFAETAGYEDPITETNTNFENWEPSEAPAAVGGNSAVLVDFVEETSIDADGAIDCPALIFDLNSPLTGEVDATAEQYNYVLSPADATNRAGFFACIRQPDLADGSFRANQDVYLFLRGNAESANRFLQPAGVGSRFPVLQTQVQLGGVINRDSD
ncbi:prepilin-type n-terminal cleavage methylation domain-containing protein [Leptolyngbya sp. Heron Island J]|uniref:PulJ/GspJ family protein n=1 Tax=Leptolyngbya sp. Heron Island J TaxID=1385935 RepID=UPI0003B9BC2B|nr:type II secretion system protein [Leptolyngbya sp. Heron Island J]ESA32690.1 prepilin-type n-terminal cleavage methylation domain-containing protein [Leptolyngbya sp. Heron Island J]